MPLLRPIFLVAGLFVISSITACGSSDSSSNEKENSGDGDGDKGGDGDGDNGPISDAPVPLEDLCPLFTSDLCIYLRQCGEWDYRDQEHCEQEMQCFGLEQLEQSAEAGRVEYNPGAVGACHARFMESPCEFAFFWFTPDIYDVLAVCEDTLEPLQRVGEECVADGECVSRYCSKEGRSCPGTCLQRGREGQSCADTSCEDGLECNANRICRAPIPAGDPCDEGFECYDSSSSTRNGELIDTSLLCDRRTNTCQLSPVVGEECGWISIGENVSDGFSAYCQLGWCDNDGFETGTCQAPSNLGGGCETSNDCLDDLRCIPSDTSSFGICSEPGSTGAACAVSNDCQEGLFCSEVGLCAAKLGSGASCMSDSQCASDICGDDGLCKAGAYPGEACSDVSIECVFGRCVDGTCVRRQRVGEPCEQPSDCATGECFEGSCADDSVCAPE